MANTAQRDPISNYQNYHKKHLKYINQLITKKSKIIDYEEDGIFIDEYKSYLDNLLHRINNIEIPLFEKFKTHELYTNNDNLDILEKYTDLFIENINLHVPKDDRVRANIIYLSDHSNSLYNVIQTIISRSGHKPFDSQMVEG